MLDLVRGLAAISVLIWHYQHFYIQTAGGLFHDNLRSHQPLYSILSPFYLYGYLAVSLFWLISGFVFAAIYVGRQTSARSFAINRFARLYPLHFMTLVLVAVLQWTSVRLGDGWKIYDNNDIGHFIPQLFMASNWLTSTVFSFNGPIWSVSIEIIFYVLFWITLPFLYRLGVIGVVVLALTFWIIARFSPTSYIQIFECGFYFFCGVSCFILSCSMGNVRVSLFALAAFSAGIITYYLFPVHMQSLSLPLWLSGLLLLFIVIEPLLGTKIARYLNWFGDSTYGIYLWHVPFQIAILIVLDNYVGSRSIIQSPLFFISFVILVVAFARLSFVFYELPMRRWLRQLDKSAPPPLEATAPTSGISPL